MGQSNYVHLDDCDILAETGNALLVRYDDGEFWLPRSQVADAGDYQAGDQGVTLSVTEWIARQKGIVVGG